MPFLSARDFHVTHTLPKRHYHVTIALPARREPRASGQNIEGKGKGGVMTKGTSVADCVNVVS